MEELFSVYLGNDFEPIKEQINQLEGVPEEGIPGQIYGNGLREDGVGTTHDIIDTIKHPTEDKGFVRDNPKRKQEIHDLVVDNCHHRCTLAQMVAEGFIILME